jgi:uncharacterized membrane protein YhhN
MNWYDITRSVVASLAIIAALLHIRSASRGPRWQRHVFKTMAMIWTIVIAASALGQVSPFYKAMIIGGLSFSLIGDLLLLYPHQSFLHALSSFLVAHLFYIAAFATGAMEGISLTGCSAFVFLGFFLFWLVGGHLGTMKAPVTFYLVVLMVMGLCATSRWLGTGESGSVFAFAGAILFILSDALLGIDRFRHRFKGAQVLVLGTYYAAQLLIAFSV